MRAALVSILRKTTGGNRPIHRHASVPAENPPPENCATLLPGPSILTGTGKHRPNPGTLFLPGLRSLPFWTAPPSPGGAEGRRRIAYGDGVVSEVVEEAEGLWENIREEYLALKGSGAREDYVNGGDGGHATLHDGKWDWHSFMRGGKVGRDDGPVASCPVSAGLLLGDVGATTAARHLFRDVPFGYAFFSALGGESSIKAHCGPMNLRLRVHLPLIVPSAGVRKEGGRDPPCGIRVGNEIREWEEGRAIVLDDSFEHEVWNETSDERVILLFDIWHPDIHPEERERIVEMFRYARKQGWIGNEK